MKKLMMICFALVLGVGVCMAQKPAKKAAAKMQTTVFVTSLDCPNCAKKVENNVPSLGKGIKDLQIDLKTREVTVTYDASKNNDANIIEGFKTLKVAASVKSQK